ncbi:MAG: DUF2062 domain-containing protein [Desulfobacterales bacterium]|jgi:uncharacterized protein (DUF2062 family)
MSILDKTKILSRIEGYLKEGMSHKKIALCIAMGIVLGIFPVLGATTVLCTIAALAFRLNIPLIQLVNYAVYPLQLFLLGFFYGVGGWLFSDLRSPFSKGEILAVLQDDLWGSIIAFWDLTLYATFLWILIGPFLGLLCYGILNSVIPKLVSDEYPQMSNVK